MARDTIIDRLLEKADQDGDKPALHYRDGDDWPAITWGEYAEMAKKFAGAMLELGCEDETHVNICGYNCPEWVIADVGAMMCNGVPSGIYHTNSPKKLAYIVDHSEAEILVLEDREQYDKFDEKRDELDTLEQVVMIRDADEIDDEMVVDFYDFLERGNDRLEDVEECIDNIDPEALGTMIYTSGTTGPPKGVMISHQNLSETADMAEEVVPEDFTGDDDAVVSYLPLAHIAEQMFSVHLAISLGYPVWFAPSLDEVKDTLQVARPTLFFAVPRVWEKFKAAIEGKLDDAGALKSMLVGWAQNVGAEAGYQIVEHGQPQGFTSFKYNIAKSLVFDKLASEIGLDRLKIAISAAAPIGKDVLEFFMGLDIIIREVYGQSEDCGPTTFNYPTPGGTKIGTVGKPMPRVDVKIADDGEVLVKGPNVFQGYYKMPDKTDEVLKDGWLHSGDIGEFDEDGFLSITDRKKNIIITGGGKNIAPAPLEGGIKEHGAVSQAVVIGDERKYLTALITLDPEAAPAMADKNGWPTDLEELAEHEAFVEDLRNHVKSVNDDFARVETVKKFTILPDEFTQEDDELTPTQKVKRRVVTEKYSDEIDAMYDDEGGVEVEPKKE